MHVWPRIEFDEVDEAALIFEMEEEAKNFMQANKLEEYITYLEEKGYDLLEDVFELSEDDLAKFMKEGHMKRFLRKIEEKIQRKS